VPIKTTTIALAIFASLLLLRLLFFFCCKWNVIISTSATFSCFVFVLFLAHTNSRYKIKKYKKTIQRQSSQQLSVHTYIYIYIYM